jgi:hypothetical protein
MDAPSSGVGVPAVDAKTQRDDGATTDQPASNPTATADSEDAGSGDQPKAASKTRKARAPGAGKKSGGAGADDDDKAADGEEESADEKGVNRLPEEYAEDEKAAGDEPAERKKSSRGGGDKRRGSPTQTGKKAAEAKKPRADDEDLTNPYR